jgi:hypothetical protein
LCSFCEGKPAAFGPRCYPHGVLPGVESQTDGHVTLIAPALAVAGAVPAARAGAAPLMTEGRIPAARGEAAPLMTEERVAAAGRACA